MSQFFQDNGFVIYITTTSFHLLGDWRGLEGRASWLTCFIPLPKIRISFIPYVVFCFVSHRSTQHHLRKDLVSRFLHQYKHPIKPRPNLADWVSWKGESNPFGLGLFGGLPLGSCLLHSSRRTTALAVLQFKKGRGTWARQKERCAQALPSWY